MSYVEGSSKTFISTNDLSSSGQFCICKMDSTANSIVLATAGTDKSIGVVMGTPKAGDITEVRLRTASGTLQVLAGGTIAVGDAVTATTGGKAITTTTAGDQILGYALYAAASGDLVEVLPATAKY